MNTFFKKSAIALTILGMAATAHAGSVNGIFGGIEALNLQPRNGDQDFLVTFPLFAGPTADAGPVQILGMHPSYQWNFRVFAGLQFCGNEDMTVSWLRTRLTNSTEINRSLYNPDSGLPLPTIPRFLDLDTWAGLSAHVSYKLDDVYGVYGHTLHANAWTVRFAAGVEWANLVSHFATEGVVLDTTTLLQVPGIIYEYESENQLRGYGPRVEADFTYLTPVGIGVFAKANVALLIASRNVSLVSNDVANIPDYEWNAHRVVIPKMGIRLGANYTYAFGAVGGEGLPSSGTIVTIEAGWQTETFIHAIERSEGFQNLSIPATAVSNAITKTSNYSDQGWFIGVTVGTDWA